MAILIRSGRRMSLTRSTIIFEKFGNDFEVGVWANTISLRRLSRACSYIYLVICENDKNLHGRQICRGRANGTWSSVTHFPSTCSATRYHRLSPASHGFNHVSFVVELPGIPAHRRALPPSYYGNARKRRYFPVFRLLCLASVCSRD